MSRYRRDQAVHHAADAGARGLQPSAHAGPAPDLPPLLADRTENPRGWLRAPDARRQRASCWVRVRAIDALVIALISSRREQIGIIR